MHNLHSSKDYHWALFVGHLVLEKLLKALYVRKFKTQPVFLHDLVRLADQCELQLTEEQKDILDTATTFNINARYEDYKMEFYRRCTAEFTQQWITQIEQMRLWIREQLNRQ